MGKVIDDRSAAAAYGPLLRNYAISAGLILALTGLAKVWSATGDVKLLSVADPIIGLPFKHMMMIAAVAELAIAAVCLFSRARLLAILLVAWISTTFLIYRLGLWWMGWRKPCGCLGNITDALGITPQTADHMVKVLLAYLLIGSYGLLIWEWRRRRKTVPKIEDGGLKMAE
jgi:hypothetical protein